METYNPRHVLFLVGMHRSGTSALSAALHACGASFGSGLLEPMERVNERGFWESAEVVALNERLLASAGASWYSVISAHFQLDWRSAKFELERREAEDILRRGFGSGPLEVVKDPRLCITLPFWLAICRDVGLRTSVCVMTRAPAEVCQSLEDRDGFPIGYGIRLLRTYLWGITASVPSDTLYATYDRLLGEPVDLLREFEKVLPIVVNEQGLIAAVLVEMKHQIARQGSPLIDLPDYKNIDFESLDAQIEELYPIESTLTDLASKMVYRGKELTRISEAHTRALRTLSERDSDIKRLSDELAHARSIIETRDAERDNLDQKLHQIGNLHTQALATVNERDHQLKNFDFRLQEIGELHTKALRVIGDKDSTISELVHLNGELEATLKESDVQLQRIFQKPGVGILFRAMWKYETC